MIKIAIQLCGQIRSWEKAFPHLKEFKEYALCRNIHIHYFLATWDRSGIKLDYSNRGPKVDIDTHYFQGCSIDPQPNKGPKFLIPNRWAKSNRLRNDYEELNNISYDAVVLTRPDIIFTHKFLNTIESKILNLESANKYKIKDSFNLGCVYSAYGPQPDVSFHKQPDNIFKEANHMVQYFCDDRLLVGHPIVMNTFSNVINEICLNTIMHMAHYVITSHCMLMGILNLSLEQGFKLSRDGEYPSFHPKREEPVQEPNIGDIIYKDLTPEDQKNLDNAYKKRNLI